MFLYRMWFLTTNRNDIISIWVNIFRGKNKVFIEQKTPLAPHKRGEEKIENQKKNYS